MDNSNYEFQYVEFIRNPEINESNKGTAKKHIKCIALDYFDLIYSCRVESFNECMSHENGIPCEAYQSIGMFRKYNNNDDSDPFELDTNNPFLSILQISLTPESYSRFKKDQEFNINFINNDIKELEQITEQSKKEFLNNDDILIYKIYQTVNTMDFCVVLSSNCMEFSLYLSNKIKSIILNNKSKYSVYTVMGISPSLNSKSNIKYINEDTVLVAQVHLQRNTYNEFLSHFREELKNEKDTDTHVLPGRYDLSIRINNSNNIISILPKILSYINRTILNEIFDQNNSYKGNNSINNTNKNNVLSWLIDNKLIEYINVRMFFNSSNNFNIKKDNSNPIEITARKPSNKIFELFEQFNKNAKELNEYRKIKGYIGKLRNIVHIYIALYSKYDTNLSMKMLGEYLLSFISLLSMNMKFLLEKKVSLNDFEMNFSNGINYLQQYIKVVTSVNSSSFEAPKYETEKDECCIVKLPIAYTQLLCSVFDNYYEKRKKLNDDEFKSFPKYKPLVIPYLQNINSNFCMTTLFSQNISDNWSNIKKDWEEHNEKNLGALMYIICNDSDKYKDISSVIISTFHEVGHYCNCMTRKERNQDILNIFVEIVSKEFIKKFISMSTSNYDVICAALYHSAPMHFLYENINNALEEYLINNMALYMDYPSNTFIVKLGESINQLTYIFANIPKRASEPYFFNSIKDSAKYMFEIENENLNFNTEEDVINLAIYNCIKNLNKINDLNNDQDYLNQNNYIILFVKSVQRILIQLKTFNSQNVLKETFKNDGQLSSNLNEIINLYNIINFNDNYIDYKINIESSLIKELKEYMRNVITCINFCIRSISNYKLLTTAENSLQMYSLTKLKDVEGCKEKFIEYISKNYFNNCSVYFKNYNTIDDGLIELYSDLHMLPSSSAKEFKKTINLSLKGMEIPTSDAEFEFNTYNESIADIIMCINLNLTIEEYITCISDVFLDKGSMGRLIIVISFLLLREENFIEIPEKIEEKFEEKITSIIAVCKNDKVSNILKTISRQGKYIFESKLFEIAINRLFQSYKNMKIVDSDEFQFVKNSLILKNTQNKTTNNKPYQLENDEIDFILKYYYMNRYKYSIDEQEGKNNGSK